MATRNRTVVYRRHRDAVKSVRAPLFSSASGSGGPVIEMASLLGSNRSSYAPLSTEDPGPSSRDAFTVGLPPSWKLSASGSAEDSNVRKNVQRSLATDLQNLSVDLRRKQSTYLKRLQQQKEGPDGVDLEMNLNGNKSRLEDDEFRDVGFNEQQTVKIKKVQQEREREINQVVQSVNELAQIMKDLSVLVIDQGTIVDRIDYNIQNVAVSVDEGRENTEERWNGDVCDGACYYVLHHASPSDTQGDTLLIMIV
ncbi:syntaxin-43 [Quercus suber]|uniref:Syntaxin-43 n=1 Tax=Quercus suber TaxID=58331 RepID=A0AAW0L784_QUESU